MGQAWCKGAPNPQPSKLQESLMVEVGLATGYQRPSALKLLQSGACTSSSNTTRLFLLTRPTQAAQGRQQGTHERRPASPNHASAPVGPHLIIPLRWQQPLLECGGHHTNTQRLGQDQHITNLQKQAAAAGTP
jgi:hypothetical protein